MKKINFELIIYVLGLFLLVASNLLCNVTFISNYLFYIKFISYFLFIFDIFLVYNKNPKISTKQFLITGILFLISIIVYYKAKDTIFLDLLFVVLASSNKKFNNILKYDLIIKIIITSIIIISNSLGYAESQFLVTRDGEYLRNAYGFYHPNTLGMYLMMIYFEFVLLNRKKTNLKIFLLGIIMVIVIFITCNSRTAYYSIILFLIYLVFNYFYKKIKKSDFKISKIPLTEYMFIFVAALSLVITKLYESGNHIAIFMDKVLSNRLSLQVTNMQAFPISIFGDKITYIRTLDNGFIKLLLSFGIVSFIFYIIIFVKTIKKAKIKNNNILIVILLIFLYFTLLESSMLYIYYNILLVYIFCKEANDE